MTIAHAPHLAARVAFYGLMGCWWIFGLTFWLRKQPPRTREAKRDGSSLLGLLLQAAGYFIVWFVPLQHGHLLPKAYGSPLAEWLMASIILMLAIASVWLVNSAARRLGKQWALAARLVEDHTLVQEGPYRFVRNPIYTGMLGMLVATGLAGGRWIALLVAMFLFGVGTWIRIRSEERLLREAFGSEFDRYAEKVPALIPGIY